MDPTQARTAARNLLASSPPGVPDAVLQDQIDDHGWCYVLQWTTQRALTSRSAEDAPPPGAGPIAVDKSSAEALYLSSVPLPVALDMARSQQHGH